ncbi:MAG: SAM-dependent methyltransferase [Betaproteobacteria bacterium]
MSRWMAAALLFAASFAWALEEVPFVTTPDKVAVAMLELARVAPRDFVIDLGSGDGRIVIMAARRFGARGLGIELDPQLVERSRAAAQRAGVADRAHFRELDLFKADLTPASVITMYLLPDVNLQLRPKLLRLRPGTRIVSHDWDMGEWTPDRTITVDVRDKPIGREKISRVHLWIVPARVDGAWCGTGKARGARLEIAQAFQRFKAQVTRETAESFDGTIQGAVLLTRAGLRFDFDGQQIRNTHASGKLAFIHGAKFRRARGPACR